MGIETGRFMTSDYDVIVFGAGMVGAAAALTFARQGKTVAIVEPANPEPISPSAPPDKRVSAISLGSEKMLTELGAWQHLQQDRLHRYSKLSVWELAQNQTEFTAAEADVSWLGHIMENLNLQLALHQALRAFEQQTTWYQKGEVLNAQTGGCLLDGAEKQGALIIAADGGFSPVRRKVQIGETGWQYAHKVLAVNIKSASPSIEHTFQQFSPDGPMAYLPLFDHYASLVWYNDAQQVARLMKLNKEQLKTAIVAHFPKLHSDFEILDVTQFPIRRNHANQYFKGRVVLCGDAAHNINPLAGQGVNIGFQDVAELGKLELSKPLAQQLNAYESARRYENALMMSTMDAFNLAFGHSSPILKGIRNAGLFLAQRSGPLKSLVLKRALGI